MTAGKENVAIFNPLVLPLPSWHPDGPDGAVDGYRIPFVMPPQSAGLQANRHARINVYPDDAGRWAAILSNVYMAGAECVTPEQARTLAAAWIRAAEVLENVAIAEAARAVADDGIVDAEVVEDDDPIAEGDRVMVVVGDWGGRFGQVYATHLDNQPPMVEVELDPPGRPDDPNEPVMICVLVDDVTIGRKP